ncbi:MAG: 50S ribosomal protein L18 [Candidatus Moranbacteria bacterium RIFOXYB1_FULL_43_19]|nr:MAG: 50S ribosomal protein L18 [Candidatus Moranbacteria bacterium RIFOXYB1_FULL_43_19]OGI28139.1 MAG: 50S ribosomal protein L18 [Candidatus Moranbacteria bacterium RIFOXYA1_FULL_44_7]OGI34146.1 MAG: 50S ribosomal protein L18 [Candidatus Moranbacteria bacterium RIFOXYC1_FULL_44_13]OGI38333.1 MAG: 50S ribosomal protein L18 [Candidatus Moranbacteria bacterium RIFOXYD1_FULL_44_12]
MNKLQLRKKRARRGRTKIFGTASCPRLCIFRSLKYIYVQLIDDEKEKTVFSLDSRKMKDGKNIVETARKIGAEMAKMAQAKKIKQVVFDRHGYKYHGKVKALAEGAREGGLIF